ncbi:L-asparaginase [Virgibacillus phasianinus]|uniref:asparaginase n=1 Tax=Virgibacillus phasianinus TaxID=2017483 RepID=A0A220U6I1_9BACI|nr:asparaginase [Virgibacillus phasianinus]ASK63323.1 L-asparaginase [Virgibacillus phasianinus]
MKKVVVLTTGGTIASKKNSESGLLESGVINGNELLDLCDIPSDINIDIQVESVFQKASMHITYDDLLLIKERIDDHLMKDEVAGVVITHGTDTLEETSYFLNLVTNHVKPIVVTGSQRSPDEIGTDSFVNIKHSILAACSKDLWDVGVVVVFNERIFHSKYVKKEHASNIQGFNSFGFGYLGIIDNGYVHVHQKPITNEFFQLKKKLPEVDIIKCFMDSDDKYIRTAREAKVQGLILEGVGRGQVPPRMVEEIKQCVKSGIKVVITTSAEEGEVYTTYDYLGSAYDLYKNGVILGRDYDSKKARIKLMVGLASEYPNIERIYDPSYY